MTTIEKIKAEIERRYKEFDGKTGDIATASRLAYLDVISFLDTLESEKPVPNDLAEEVKRFYSDNFEYLSSNQPTLSILTNIANHFTDWQKEQMMKEAVEGTVHNFSSYKPHPTVLVDARGFNQGDKVRVIVCPKED